LSRSPGHEQHWPSGGRPAWATTWEDLACSYRTSLPESQKIAGLAAFCNERVDLFIDDQLQQRPVTKFSR
jgi:hypothetical protein